MEVYKFLGTPFQAITSRVTGRVIFTFDRNGSYLTDDPIVIELARGHFRHQALTVTVVPEEAETSEPDDISDGEAKFHCKKCDYTTNNHGELLAHYRWHSKEGT
jgi:hypothetical protein